MIERLKIRNTVTNKSIELSKSGGNYILDSIDWGFPTVTKQSFRVPYQIGETQTGVIIGTRKPVIIGYVIADISQPVGISLDDYYKKQLEIIERKKGELNKLFSVFQEVILEVQGGYFLKVIPTQPVLYSNMENENNEVLCLFQIELESYKPLFYKGEKKISLATITGKFHFPLIIPEKGMIFGEIKRRQAILIENAGDSEVGCVIEIVANGGTVRNPKIYNVTTGDFIEFENVELQNGDYITITTETQEENAIKHEIETGKETSLVGNIKEGSKFIQILQGNNFYAYSVEQQYMNNIEVSIRFTEKFFNFEAM